MPGVFFLCVNFPLRPGGLRPTGRLLKRPVFGILP